MVATRTPEGDPLKCSICGSISLVLVSYTGDSVCPSCGSFSWVSITRPTPPLLNANQHRTLTTVLDAIRLSKTKDQIGYRMVEGISALLKTTATSLLEIDRRIDSKVHLKVIARDGKSTFGDKTSSTMERTDARKLGVYMRTKNGYFTVAYVNRHDRSLSGLIVIEQTTPLPIDHIDEQLRLAYSIVSVAIGTGLLG